MYAVVWWRKTHLVDETRAKPIVIVLPGRDKEEVQSLALGFLNNGGLLDYLGPSAHYDQNLCQC